jgi:hypothetical protein
VLGVFLAHVYSDSLDTVSNVLRCLGLGAINSRCILRERLLRPLVSLSLRCGPLAHLKLAESEHVLFLVASLQLDDLDTVRAEPFALRHALFAEALVVDHRVVALVAHNQIGLFLLWRALGLTHIARVIKLIGVKYSVTVLILAPHRLLDLYNGGHFIGLQRIKYLQP